MASGAWSAHPERAQFFGDGSPATVAAIKAQIISSPLRRRAVAPGTVGEKLGDFDEFKGEILEALERHAGRKGP